MKSETVVASQSVTSQSINLLMRTPCMEAQDDIKSQEGRALVIADATLEDVDVLLDRLETGTDLWRVELCADFSSLLKEAFSCGYERIHFLGHGQPGAITLGGRKLQVDDFAVPSDAKFAVAPSLHFWSCLTGAGEKGRAFVDGVAKVLGSAVTAFNGLVGARSKGGSWLPDVFSGNADSVAAPFENALAYGSTFVLSIDLDRGDFNYFIWRDFTEVNGPDDGSHAVSFTNNGGLSNIWGATCLLSSFTVSIDSTTVATGDVLVLGSTEIDLTSSTSANDEVLFNSTYFRYDIADENNTRMVTFTSLDGSGGSAVYSDMASYELLLDTLQFNSTSDKVVNGSTRVFDLRVYSGLSVGVAPFGIKIIATNDAPAFSAFTGEICSTSEGLKVAVTFAELLAKSNAADSDGTVDAFVIKAVSSGTLLIGTDASNATAYDAATNNAVDATHQAYWMPDSSANGTVNAFTAVARDDGGAESIAAVQATVRVTPENNAPTFFKNGYGTSFTDFGGADTGYSIALQGDLKILVAGYSSANFTSDFALARYNADGSLDASFSEDGILTTDFGGLEYCRSLTIQSDGQILVAGTSDSRITLARYNSDGTLDTRFDGDGKVMMDILSPFYASMGVVQVDGKILLAGGSNADFVLLRFNMDGTPDTTFSDDGKLATDFNGGTDQGNSVIVQSDSKILVAGSSSRAFALARYNTDGTPDTMFGTGGQVITDLTTGLNSWSSAESVTLQLDNKILVAGMTYNADIGRYDFTLVRYNSDGKLDISFDGDGIVTTGLSQYDKGYSVAVQSDGKIVVAGTAQWGSLWGIAVVRYQSDGTLDTSFDGDGRVTTTINNVAWGSCYGADMTVQSDGKILVSGSVDRRNNIWNGDNVCDVVVVRYNTDGSLDNDFGQINTLDGRGVYNRNRTPVVLDSDVQIYDADLAMAGNYSGATLTLSRHGGANSNDLFSAKHSGTLGALSDGRNLTIGGLSIGVINSNNDGQLEITFNDHATQGYVNSVLQQIAYSNNSEASTATVQIDWTFTDGNTGNQGASGALSVTGSTLTKFNNAPTGTVLITGSAVQGQVLTASHTLEDLDGIGNPPSYVWRADGLVITGGNTLSLTQYQVGKHITVEAGYWDNLMNYETVSSLQTVLVNPEGTLSPTLLTLSPAEGATAVMASDNIEFTFNVPVKAGTGAVVLHSGSATGAVVASYDVAKSPNITISGNALIVNPTTDLAGSTHYYVTLDAGSVNDLAGNPVAALTYDFTTDGPIVEKATLFTDDFNTSLNPASWDYNHWKAIDNPSFYGRTQQRQELPGVSDGLLHLKLDTFNPTYNPADPNQVPSFYGSEAITTAKFSNDAGGIVFEIKAHFVNPVVDGIVGGMFSYINNSGSLHDEIDFEAVSNKLDQIQTNIYANEPRGAGNPQFNPISGDLTDAHIYRIEWFKNAVRWIVDGQLVRVETTNIPQQPMALHLNIWAPGKEWIEGFSDALNPVINLVDNTDYYFDVDSVRVAQLSSTYYYSDNTAPTLISASPVDGATGIAVGNDIVFTFSEAIQKGSGAIEIYSGSAAGTLVAHYDAATSTNLTITGNTLTINPTTDLEYKTSYFITVGADAINDFAGNSYAGTTTFDFITKAGSTFHNQTGSVTFWKTGDPITDVTSTLVSAPVSTGTQPIEFRNVQLAADGTRTMEIWETSAKSDIESVQLELAFSTGLVATWQDAVGLPSGWNSAANNEMHGKFLLAGMGITPLSSGPVKLGTLTLSPQMAANSPADAQRIELSLTSGLLGTEIIAAFSIVSDSMTTGTDGLFQHIDMPDGTYALTSAKVSGMAESNAVKTHDALAALKIAVGMNPNADGRAVSPYQYLAADSNKDGQVRASDALNILKMAVKLDTAPASEWLFVPESVGSETMSRTNVVWPVNPTPVTLATDLDVHLIGIVRGDVDGSWAA